MQLLGEITEYQLLELLQWSNEPSPMKWSASILVLLHPASRSALKGYRRSTDIAGTLATP